MDAAERMRRINELARKKRTQGLSEAELDEQQRLRAQYLKDFRDGMVQMLEGISVQQPDGQVVPLRRKKADDRP